MARQGTHTAEVLLFHHAQGRTAGVLAFADTLRHAGHAVYVPDLYEGRTFDSLDAGVAYAQEIGLDALTQRGVAAAKMLPEHMVYAGFSLGVMPAQKLAQTRSGAAGALLFHACVPVAEFGDRWPGNVPVQVHAMDHDELFVDGGDLGAVRDLVASAPSIAELFLYRGDQHLFADNSLPSYREAAAAVLTERVLLFLETSG